jgi:hypothetical protein
MTETGTTITAREIDAKLAEAIGCKVKPPFDGLSADFDCGCDKGEHAFLGHKHSFVQPYYSKPTWETSGQLIEGLATKYPHWHIEVSTEGGFWIAVIETVEMILGQNANVYSDTGPKAIAEAARLALGIPEPTK